MQEPKGKTPAWHTKDKYSDFINYIDVKDMIDKLF